MMQTVKFVYWQDGEFWIGYFEEFPEHGTQGESFEDLKEHLQDLYKDLTSGELSNIKRVAELEVA